MLSSSLRHEKSEFHVHLTYLENNDKSVYVSSPSSPFLPFSFFFVETVLNLLLHFEKKRKYRIKETVEENIGESKDDSQFRSGNGTEEVFARPPFRMPQDSQRSRSLAPCAD